MTTHTTKGRPRANEDRPNDSTHETTREGFDVMASITTPTGEQQHLGGIPAAYASAYAPCAGRTQWAYAYQCPRCGGSHLGRNARLDTLGGLRRARCGRLVWIIPARIYGTEAAA